MKNNLLIKLLIIICFCLLFFSQQAQGQKRASCDCQVEYEDVINHLFPKYFVGLYNGYKMILRYSPPNESEVQINIFHVKPGKFEVYLYKHESSRENDSISRQLQDIQQKNCNASFSKIIRQIKVEKLRIYLTESEILKIRAGFFDVVKKSNDFENREFEKSKSNLVPINIFDETAYEVDYSGGGRIKLYGEGNRIEAEKPSEDESPFIEWMREIYKLVQARKVYENSNHRRKRNGRESDD